IANLDKLLVEFERNISARGAVVLWAKDAAEANEHVLRIAREHNVKSVVKSKSMVTEEMELNRVLETRVREARSPDGPWAMFFEWRRGDKSAPWISVPVEVSQRYKCLVKKDNPVLSAAAESGHGSDETQRTGLTMKKPLGRSLGPTEGSAAAPSAGMPTISKSEAKRLAIQRAGSKEESNGEHDLPKAEGEAATVSGAKAPQVEPRNGGDKHDLWGGDDGGGSFVQEVPPDSDSVRGAGLTHEQRVAIAAEAALSSDQDASYGVTSLQLWEGMSYERWTEIGGWLRRMTDSVGWWWGDWVNFGERVYGEKYSQAIEDSGLDGQTLRIMAYTSNEFEVLRRRNNLSWSHHREVAGLE
ncbi:hypothetical protein LCGC14_3047940, partial [marine sediment metagenome]